MTCAATTTIREALPAGHIRCTCSEGEWTYNDEALAALASLEQLVEAAQAYTDHVDAEPKPHMPAHFDWESQRDALFFNLAAALAAVGPGEETA